MMYLEKTEVGRRIKECRNAKGMTQVELAIALDFSSERHIQKLESGECVCSVDRLIEMSQILGVSTDYLLMGKKEDCSRNINAYLKERTPNEQDFAMKVLDVIFENRGQLISNTSYSGV